MGSNGKVSAGSVKKAVDLLDRLLNRNKRTDNGEG